MEPDDYQDILQKYKAKVAEEFGETSPQDIKVTSREYTEFKRELYPVHYSLYERACNFSQQILKLKVDAEKSVKVQKNLDICHLNVTPSGVTSFSILGALIFMVGVGFLAFTLPLILIGEPLFPLVIFAMIGGVILIPILQRFPGFLANSWRMKASNQMVQSVFYLVTYMRHTSNLERAIAFASEHLDAPLSIDFRKLLWDVETQKFSTIKDSAEAFLSFWQDTNKDFVQAFHLIESSLFESSDDRRLTLLDKSLDVILNGTYENMLHYAHSLKGPMTMLNMLGVILPILGLVILPLVVSFMGSGGNPFVTAIYISLLYNITLPSSVFYLGQTILSKRPAGFGASDITKKPGVKRFANVNLSLGKAFVISVNPLYFSVGVLLITMAIGFSPLIMNQMGVSDFSFDKSESIKMLDYVCPPCNPETPVPEGFCGQDCKNEAKVGPYGLGSSLLSLVVIAGLGGSLGLFYSLRSKNVIKIRERTKLLEDEFSSAMFQLGNRLGDGLPAEIAFAKVAQTMEGTTSGDFFNLAEKNITKLGMGIEQAIFDPKVGALVSFPSSIIESSMKVLTESVKKGPRIAAQALLSMSNYIKEIHRVEERLRDLMADIIGSMKAQVKFLTPAIAGIVVGITAMISVILTKLSGQLAGATAGTDGQFGGLLSIFGIGIPTFHFQIVVGIYIIQIAFILTSLASGIENGVDKLGKRFSLGKNLTRSTLLYCFIAGTVMMLFTMFASKILKGALSS